MRFGVCRNAAKALGLGPEDLQGFITVIPAEPYAPAYWQAKGYSSNAVGATVPTTRFSELNKTNIHKNRNRKFFDSYNFHVDTRRKSSSGPV